MLALGLRVARDIIALYRWSPIVFLRGLVVIRDSRRLTRIPQEIPTPALTTGTFYKAAYRSLKPHQILFTAQTFNAPCLLGVLEIPRGSSSLVMTARLNWSFYALFFVGFAFARFPVLVLAIMAAMCLLNCVWEIRECRRVLRVIGDTIDRAPTTELVLGAHEGA